MATDVGIRLGVDGEKEFRSALAGVNSQIKNLNSEMKTVVSSMSGMNSAEDAAAKKNDVLACSVTAVKQKISLISGEYDRAKGRLAELGTALENAKQEFGENSDEALRAQKAYNKQEKTVNDLGTQLNNATADLNRMENEMNDLGDSTDDTADALDSAGNSGRYSESECPQSGDRQRRKSAGRCCTGYGRRFHRIGGERAGGSQPVHADVRRYGRHGFGGDRARGKLQRYSGYPSEYARFADLRLCTCVRRRRGGKHVADGNRLAGNG